MLAGSARPRWKGEGGRLVGGKLGQYRARRITGGRIPGKTEEEGVRRRRGGDRVVRQENAGKSCMRNDNLAVNLMWGCLHGEHTMRVGSAVQSTSDWHVQRQHGLRDCGCRVVAGVTDPGVQLLGTTESDWWRKDTHNKKCTTTTEADVQQKTVINVRRQGDSRFEKNTAVRCLPLIPDKKSRKRSVTRGGVGGILEGENSR